MKKIFLLGLLILFLGGCATVKVSKLPAKTERVEVKTIYIESFKCVSEEMGEAVKNSLISSLLGIVKIVDDVNKADAIIKGVVTLSGESQSLIGGAGSSYGWGVGGGSSKRIYIKSASVLLKSKEGEILYSVSFGQDIDKIMWSGEKNPVQIGNILGEKLKEYFK